MLICALSSAFKPRLDILFFNSGQLHFAIPGLEVLALPITLFVFGWLSLIGSILAFFGIWSRYTYLVAGMCLFAVAMGTTEGRLAFAYFPPLALVAIGVQAYFRSNAAPLLIMLSSVYLGAAAHKLIFFTDMIEFLPRVVREVMALDLGTSNPELVNFLSTGMAWTVTPVELLMGFGLLFRRTRPFAFLIACTFHCLINLLGHRDAAFLDVGTYLLAMHVIVATEDSELSVADLFRRRSRQTVWGLLFFTSILFFIFPLGQPTQAIAQTVTFYGPLIAIASMSYFGSRCDSQIYRRGPSVRPLPGFAQLAFALIVIAWTFTPALTNHTNDHLGWAVFSSSSSKTRFSCVRVSTSIEERCTTIRGRAPVIIVRPKPGGDVELCSRYLPNLEKLLSWLQQNCKSTIRSSPVYQIEPDGPEPLNVKHM